MFTVEERQLDVLERRRARQEIKALENETKLAIANVGQLIAVETGNIEAIEQVAAVSWAIEATEQIHQGGFPRTTRAHKGDKLTARDFQRNAANGGHVHFTGTAGCVHVLQPNDSGTRSHIDSPKTGAVHRPPECSIVAPHPPPGPSLR